MHIKRYSFLFLSLFFLFGCRDKTNHDYSNHLSEWNNLIIELTKTDGINPVLSTRIFLYPNLASYLAYYNHSALEAEITKKGFKRTYRHNTLTIDREIAAIAAFYYVILPNIFRAEECALLFEKQLTLFKKKYTNEIITNSVNFGKNMAKDVNDWSKGDGYFQTKGMQRYSINNSNGEWIPTPPEYRSALEPNWGKLRPITFDSADIFSVNLNYEFDTNSNSTFFKEAKYVYEKSSVLQKDELSIALFWDDNPDLNKFVGHTPMPRRHISPAAHWFSILNQIILKDTIAFSESIALYTSVAIAMYDSKIVCWHDKYKYKLIRPVTYINKYMDPNWLPVIVTPPFPEFPSGHSACSNAVCVVLGHYLGETYSFIDSTHFDIGLGTRRFSSFSGMAQEVSNSRVYGGIHYRTGCEAGLILGNNVGKNVIAVVNHEK